jgi:hypothetical protein
MNPTDILRLEVRGFLFLLAALLAGKMLTGGISLAGLLASKDGDVGVSPERIQLLLATLALGAKYIGSVAHGTDVSTMPDVGKDWLYLFGGSSGLYASVKAARMWGGDKRGR